MPVTELVYEYDLRLSQITFQVTFSVSNQRKLERLNLSV